MAGYRRGDGGPISDDAFAEGREDTAGSTSDPGGQSVRITVAHHSVEAPTKSRAVTSVKMVEKRISEEVANGQAAMGGSFAGSASISGGVSSAIPSICM